MSIFSIASISSSIVFCKSFSFHLAISSLIVFASSAFLIFLR